jgi:hypothetical protein
MTLANSRYGPEVETRLAVFAQDQESANRHARNNITPHDRLVNMSNIESEEALYSASGQPINVAKQYLNKDAAVSKYFDEEVIFNSSHTNIDRGRRDCLSKYVPDDLVGTSPPPLPRQHRAQPRQQYTHDPTSPDYSTESDESSVLSSTPSPQQIGSPGSQVGRAQARARRATVEMAATDHGAVDHKINTLKAQMDAEHDAKLRELQTAMHQQQMQHRQHTDLLEQQLLKQQLQQNLFIMQNMTQKQAAAQQSKGASAGGQSPPPPSTPRPAHLQHVQNQHKHVQQQALLQQQRRLLQQQQAIQQQMNPPKQPPLPVSTRPVPQTVQHQPSLQLSSLSSSVQEMEASVRALSPQYDTPPAVLLGTAEPDLSVLPQRRDTSSMFRAHDFYADDEAPPSLS